MGLLAPEPPAHVRCSDADRERTIDILRNESVAGRISEEELSDRLDKAFAARTLGELRALVADLPAGNVNPLYELVGGVVTSGMRIVRISLWAGLAVSVGIVVLIAVVAVALRFL